MMHYSRLIVRRKLLICRLSLSIGNERYGLSRLDRAGEATLEAWRLVKGDGTTYDCTLSEGGPSCDCPDFIWRREGVSPDGCKHIRGLEAVGLLGGRRR
jgi:predicted nucleic acid-binding Zn finger protein